MSLISKSDCAEILQNKLDRMDFQLEDFELKYFDELLGFHSSHASLTIQAIIDDTIQGFKFFVKTSTNNDEINEKYWKVMRHSYKEHISLTELLKSLQNFVTKKITADCYLSKLDRFMVLEDLRSLEYVPARIPSLDLHHAEQAVLAFANLHASSLIYEEKTGVSLTEKYEHIAYEGIFFESTKHPNEFLLYSLDQGVRAIGAKHLTHINSDERDRVFGKIRKRVVDVLNHRKDFRKVACQGDPWGNNLLYRYNNEGKPTDAILVDFGVLRLAPPAVDLIQFLYIGTPTEFRARYKSHIKDTYYRHLGNILAENGLDVSTILPRTQFMETCDIYEEFGICSKIYYQYVTRLPGPYLLKAGGSADEFLGLMTRGDSTLTMDAYENDETYRKGLKESIEDAFRYYQ